MKKIENFRKSLANLQQTRRLQPPYDIVVLTGIIGLFSICFEQAWKAMKHLLEESGSWPQKTGSPKLIIKLAYQCGMLHDESAWLELLNTRNLLAHTYDEQIATQCIESIKNKYLPLFETLEKEMLVWI